MCLNTDFKFKAYQLKFWTTEIVIFMNLCFTTSYQWRQLLTYWMRMPVIDTSTFQTYRSISQQACALVSSARLGWPSELRWPVSGKGHPVSWLHNRTFDVIKMRRGHWLWIDGTRISVPVLYCPRHWHNTEVCRRMGRLTTQRWTSARACYGTVWNPCWSGRSSSWKRLRYQTPPCE